MIMWIELISIENFQAFDAARVEFSPGLNIVLSPNEGGKSSLFRAILTALFTDSSSKSVETRNLARWGSEGFFKLEMELWLGPSCHRIVKDFRSRDQAVFRRGSVEPIAKGKAVGTFLRSHLPLPDESLFLRVCGVRHEELAAVCDGETSIGERLEGIVGGGSGEATPAQIEQMLETKRAELMRGADHPAHERNWGPVKRFQEAVALGETDCARALATAARREELLRSISIVGSKIAELDAGLALLEEKGERAKRRAYIGRNVQETKGRAEALRKRMERLRELVSRQESAAERGNRFPEALRCLAPESLDELRREVERERLLEEEVARRAEKPMRVPVWHIILGSVLVVAGLVGGLLWERIIFSVAGLGSVILLFLVMRSRAKGRPVLPHAQQLELSSLAGRRRGWAGERSFDDSSRLLGDTAAWQAERRQIDIRLEEAAGGQRIAPADLIERLDAEYGDLSRELRGLEEEFTRLEPFELDADALIAVERDMTFRKMERDTLASDLAVKERELAAFPAVDCNEIRERIESAREGLRLAERKAAVIGVVLEALGEARSQVSGFLAAKLPPLASGYLSSITGGRYRSLVIDPVRLGVHVSPAAQDFAAGGTGTNRPERIEPAVLSQGTRDQIHLAIRLALVNLLSRAEPQPLFLDDPFIHFDPERRRRALELILDLARRHQIIFFTCDPGYRDIGGRLIELDRCRGAG